MRLQPPLLLAVAAASMLAGCQDAKDSRVTVEYVPRDGVNVVAFGASVRAGQIGKSFVVDATASPAPVLELVTPADGFAVVTIALGDASTTLGGGSAAIALRADEAITVHVQVDSMSPAATCTDCRGVKSFVLAGTAQRVAKDSIWLTWTASPGGTSITK